MDPYDAEVHDLFVKSTRSRECYMGGSVSQRQIRYEFTHQPSFKITRTENQLNSAKLTSYYLPFPSKTPHGKEKQRLAGSRRERHAETDPNFQE